MRSTIVFVALAVALVSPAPGLAQPEVRVSTPTKLAWVLHGLFGDRGLVVDSNPPTLDVSPHSFNGSFDSMVVPLNTALASQLVTVPTPPPFRSPGTVSIQPAHSAPPSSVSASSSLNERS